MACDQGDVCAQVRGRFETLKQQKYQAEEPDYVPDGEKPSHLSTATVQLLCSVHCKLPVCLLGLSGHMSELSRLSQGRTSQK